MALHSRDAVTVSAAVVTRSRADCSSMEDHTRLSTALVDVIMLLALRPRSSDFKGLISWNKSLSCDV